MDHRQDFSLAAHAGHLRTFVDSVPKRAGRPGRWNIIWLMIEQGRGILQSPLFSTLELTFYSDLETSEAGSGYSISWSEVKSQWRDGEIEYVRIYPGIHRLFSRMQVKLLVFLFLGNPGDRFLCYLIAGSPQGSHPHRSLRAAVPNNTPPNGLVKKS